MKTAEELKKEISRLQNELYEVELTDECVKRLEACKATGGKHKWRMLSWEVNHDYDRYHHWGSTTPLLAYGSTHEKGVMYCCCGARVTYEEGCR